MAKKIKYEELTEPVELPANIAASMEKGFKEAAAAEKEVRDEIRTLGLRWNKFRSEWYGTVSDLDALNNAIKNQTHNIEILKN